MALRHAVLASLTSQESSGYELSKRFDASVANFWPASAQQIYRELDRLEEQGMVRSKIVRQSKRPDKKVFRVTPEGAQELDEFIRGKTRPTVVRDDLLVKVASLDGSNAKDVAAAVRERLETSQQKLRSYESLKVGLLVDMSEEEFLSKGSANPALGPYLALKRGISFERGTVRWAREVLATLG